MSARAARPHALTAHRVDYATPLRAAAGSGYVGVAQRLLADLPQRWDLAYRDMTPRQTGILTTAHAGRLVRLDVGPKPARGKRRRSPDRVIAVYGRSHYYWQGRDEEAMAHFLSARAAATTSNGWLDVSALFETATQGWSTLQRTVSAMERHCATQPGTFFFVRPLYGDTTAHPVAVEYGVLRGRDDLWLERFATGPRAALPTAAPGP